MAKTKGDHQRDVEVNASEEWDMRGEANRFSMKSPKELFLFKPHYTTLERLLLNKEDIVVAYS